MEHQQQESEDQHQLGFPSSDSDDHKKELEIPPPSDLEKTVEELQSLELKDDDEREDHHPENVNDESGWGMGEEESETVNDYGNNNWSYGDDHDGENVNGEELNESGNYYSYNENENNNSRVNQYPVRTDAEDCAYYVKVGTCKFGSNCKFNHPVRRRNNQGAKEKDEFGENQSGQTECKYYLRTGGCKFGKACRYNHSKAKALGPPTTSNLNFLGLPVRPGEKECTYYMRTGSCKYGAVCRFNHPDPTAVERSNPPSSYGNGGPVSSPVAGQLATTSWSSPSALNDAAPYVPLVYPPTQGPPQGREWNNYQAPPIYPPPLRNMHQPSAYMMNNLANENNVYPHHQQQMVVDEFPERPGQPECSFYIKTGDCKFKSNCRYHHPRNRMPRSPPCPLSDKGLPLRPDQMVCSHYSRYGICKFGPSCKFDHPVQQPTSPTASGDHHQSTTFDDIRTTTNYENGMDVPIQHPA